MSVEGVDVGSLVGSSGLVGGVLVSLITWLRLRPKDRVDATVTLSDAALRQLENIEKRLAATEAALSNERSKSQRLEEALDQHRQWDILVLDKLHELGITDIPTPPKLWVV